MKLREREYGFDIIRLIATLLVIVIHISNNYCRYLPSVNSLSFTGAAIFNSLGRVSVPLFFMISGALMLHKDIDSKKLLKKVIHFLEILVFWTIVYIFFDIYFMHYTFTTEQYFTLIFDNLKPHLWFMYAIIALYLISPFARILVANMTLNQKRYFTYLWLFFCGGSKALRIVFDWFEITTTLEYEVPLVQGTYYLGYFILGSLLYEEIKNGRRINRLLAALSFILSVAVISAGTILYSRHTGKFYSQFLSYRNLPELMASLALYILVLEFPRPSKEFTKRFLAYVSPKLFGIYLTHIIWFDLMVTRLNVRSVISFIGIPMYTLAIAIISFVTVLIISKIPVLRKLVN